MMATTDRTRRLGPPLAAWGAAVAVIAALGGASTDTTSAWYEGLEKPPWQPPGWVFGPVWTILYVLLALSAALAWRDVRGPRRRLILGLYAANLVLNLGWTLVFFRAHAPWAAFGEILALLASIVALIVLVSRHNRVAAAALVPYAVWVGFASALTVAIAAEN